ncbi:Hpt domain-containing protein, partial [Myxococcota bacterium]|nr:Hpt domain-containing protein [Myxococcota bacterium]
EAVGHAHKLHGVAGSVGFPALGVAAGDVEEALRALATCPGDQVSPARWAELERALTALDACARAIAESAP